MVWMTFRVLENLIPVETSINGVMITYVEVDSNAVALSHANFIPTCMFCYPHGYLPGDSVDVMIFASSQGYDFYIDDILVPQPSRPAHPPVDLNELVTVDVEGNYEDVQVWYRG